MNEPSLASIDLNLLVVLHAVLEHRSATAAARALHVTQSAVSNALARLRGILDDPLLVRHGRGLAPTPRALTLAPVLADVVRGARAVLASGAPFDPATTTREFTLACGDYYSVVLVPSLVQRLRARAPRARLRVVTLDQLVRDGGLATDVDVHIGLPPSVPEGCLTEPLVEERFACLVRSRDERPSAPRRRSRPRRMSLAEFTAASHVGIKVLDRTRDPTDAVLASHGVVRSVAITVPHFASVPFVVAELGYVATMSRRLCEVYAKLLPLEVCEPPVDVGARWSQMIWHRRTDADEGARFFRSLVRESAASPLTTASASGSARRSRVGASTGRSASDGSRRRAPRAGRR